MNDDRRIRTSRSRPAEGVLGSLEAGRSHPQATDWRDRLRSNGIDGRRYPIQRNRSTPTAQLPPAATAAGPAVIVLEDVHWADPSSVALPLATSAAGSVMVPLLDAFRTGAGVPYAAYGPDAVEVQAALNRPLGLTRKGPATRVSASKDNPAVSPSSADRLDRTPGTVPTAWLHAERRTTCRR